MTLPLCERIALADLTDYAAGELDDVEAGALEEHLFSCADCGARAAEFDVLVRAIRRAVRSGEVGGFVTDAVLNRLAREGMRIRTFTLSPGAIVPCAVWEDDELMVLRLRGEFGDASEFTVSQRVGGTEVSRSTGHSTAGSSGELLYATPAAMVRQLPVVQVDIHVTAHVGSEQRAVGQYALMHGGVQQR